MVPETALGFLGIQLWVAPSSLQGHINVTKHSGSMNAFQLAKRGI